MKLFLFYFVKVMLVILVIAVGSSLSYLWYKQMFIGNYLGNASLFLGIMAMCGPIILAVAVVLLIILIIKSKKSDFNL